MDSVSSACNIAKKLDRISTAFQQYALVETFPGKKILPQVQIVPGLVHEWGKNGAVGQQADRCGDLRNVD